MNYGSSNNVEFQTLRLLNDLFLKKMCRQITQIFFQIHCKSCKLLSYRSDFLPLICTFFFLFLTLICCGYILQVNKNPEWNQFISYLLSDVLQMKMPLSATSCMYCKWKCSTSTMTTFGFLGIITQSEYLFLPWKDFLSLKKNSVLISLFVSDKTKLF